MTATLKNVTRKVLPVLKEAGVTRSSLFGSYVRGENRADSDVDILVELPKGNSLLDLVRLEKKLEKALGKKALENMHIHMSGINYGEKGEKNHLVLKDSDMNYKDLMKTLKEFKCKGVIICESPNLEKDALLMKKAYYSM